MKKKYEDLPEYIIGTEKGAGEYNKAERTNQVQTMSDGAQIYKGTDGRMYANYNGQTMSVKNNYNPYGKEGAGFKYESNGLLGLQQIAQQLQGMNYGDWKRNSAQYADLAKTYGQQGKRAMEDTLGQVAARTGGLASSYATGAANDSYNQYMQTLENAAMALYDSEYARKQSQYNMMRDLEDLNYGRAVDAYKLGYGKYRDELTDEQTAARDKQAQDNWERNFTYKSDQDAIAREDAAKTKAETKAANDKTEARAAVQNIIATTGSIEDIDPSMLETANYTDAELAAMIKSYDSSKASAEYDSALSIAKESGDYSNMSPWWTAEQIANANKKNDKKAAGGTPKAKYNYDEFMSMETEGEAYSYLLSHNIKGEEADEMMAYWEDRETPSDEYSSDYSGGGGGFNVTQEIEQIVADGGTKVDVANAIIRAVDDGLPDFMVSWLRLKYGV